jgi:hypothetical protein
MLTKKKARKPLKVALDENFWDRQVDELSRKGFTAETIANLSGLSIFQVRYRIHSFGNSLMDYRRGESEDAHKVIGEVHKMLRQIHGLRRKMYT